MRKRLRCTSVSRVKAHLEQEQVGKACGVTGNAISNWERDVARPDASLVPTLCNLLNIPLYDFFGILSFKQVCTTNQLD